MTSPDLTLLPASPRRAFARRLLRYLGTAGVVVLVALAGTAGWLYIQMRGSLAQLDTLGCEDLTRARAACQALMLPMQHAPGREDYLRDLGDAVAQVRKENGKTEGRCDVLGLSSSSAFRVAARSATARPFACSSARR